MPKQFSSAVMLTIFTVAIIVAANRADDGAEGNAQAAHRHVASIGGAAGAPSTKSVPYRHTEKLHGPITVAIDLVGPAPAAAGDVFVLKGRIESAQRIENVEYRWSVPASVEVVNGQLNDKIQSIAANRTADLELTLRARDAANAQIHLLATARSHHARFAESAQYNTVLEPELRAERERLMKSTETLDAAPKSGELKVFH